jgi:hypothetical protein
MSFGHPFPLNICQKIQKSFVCFLPYYIGIGDTNYIIFRNLEIFVFFPIKIIVKEFFFSRIFYLSKWKFQN